MEAYNFIVEQLCLDNPVDVNYIEPYEMNDSLKERIRQLYIALNSANRVGNYHLMLANAYHIGKILEENPFERKVLSAQLAYYTYMCSVRVYHIFRHLGVEQIYRTNGITFRQIKMMKSALFKQLVQEANTIKLERLVSLYNCDNDSLTFNGDVEN